MVGDWVFGNYLLHLNTRKVILCYSFLFSPLFYLFFLILDFISKCISWMDFPDFFTLRDNTIWCKGILDFFIVAKNGKKKKKEKKTPSRSIREYMRYFTFRGTKSFPFEHCIEVFCIKLDNIIISLISHNLILNLKLKVELSTTFLFYKNS